MGTMHDTFDSMPTTFVALLAVCGAIIIGCVALDGNRVGSAEANAVGHRADGPVARQDARIAGAQANVEARMEADATVESLAKLVNTLQADLAAIRTGDVALGPTQSGDGNVSVDCGGSLPRWLYALIGAAGIFYPAVIRPLRIRLFGNNEPVGRAQGLNGRAGSRQAGL